ncbi:c-type cytochrome, methanol metabolism-related [Methylobacterium sp. 77]|uniref:c-type cytochrome, methanol metabolism-related n=1 Tax=Methylobacterium sp. 77 TaxID=1101192 RepID=UPI0003604F19|nr:c-type cytochrome, methanol metabolism-related [Methylobacterium sp. 77]
MRCISLIGLALLCLGAVPTSSSVRADPMPPAALTSEGPVRPTRFDGIRYLDKDGVPTYRVSDGGKRVDWSSMVGYLRYNANCIVCHGPDGAGSTYAPSLVDALKHDDYATFVGIVVGGKKDVNASEQLVMPAFGEDRNVMCYIDDVYVYLRARSDGVIGRGRPGEHEPKSEAFEKKEDACMG